MSANTYIYTSVGPPGAVAQGVDDSGEVVGFYGNETGSGSGFTDIGGVFSTVVVSGATQTDVTAVADGGVIAGYLVLSGNNYPDAFVGEPGSLTIISAPSIDDPNAPYGGIGLDPSAVNAGGEVVGAAYSQGSFTYANGTYTPLVVSNSQQTVATGINDSGEVVGWYQAAGLNGEYGGFISTAAGLSTVNPFPFNAQFTAINNGGEIVGTAYPGNMGEAFTDTDGIVAILPQPPGISQVAVALNDAGTVVGYDENLGTLDSVAFIDLGGIVDTFAPAGAITTEPTGINNLGEVVGDYVDANEEAHAFTLTVTPSYTFATIALSGVQSVALNNQGEIVGTYADPTGQLHGFVDSGGAVSAFDDRGAVNTTVTAVNYGGAFTGFSSASDASGSQWFVESAGTLTDIPSGSAPVQPVAIGFGGEVAGNDGTEGFYALSGGPTRAVAVPGAVTTKVTGLNNSEIVGDYTDSAGIQHGFTDIAGTIATIDPAGSVSTTIAGVNAGGELAGTYSNGVDTVGFTEANDVFTQLTLPGSTDAVATGLNDAGSVVGYATGSDGQDHGFLYDGGSMFAIDPAGSVDTQPTAINDEG
jgi:probable HAF family extracellular repeat protein